MKIKYWFTLITLLFLLSSEVSYCQYTLEKNDSNTNIYFHQYLRSNSGFSSLSMPFIGDYHFKDYSFVEAKDGLSKYSYFLATADIAPKFYIVKNPKSSFDIGLSFRLRARVWNNRRIPLRDTYTWRASHAINTPSYQPAIEVVKKLNHFTRDDHRYMSYISLAFIHHSNGQSAPTLVAQDSTLVGLDGYKFNIEDGDFSANSLTLSYTKVADRPRLSSALTTSFKIDRLGAKYHDHDDLYRYVLGVSDHYTFFSKVVNQEIRRESFRLELDFSFGFNDFSEFSFSKNINYALTYRYKIPIVDYLGLFFTYGYYGQDTYNIYLENHFHYIRFGVSLSNIL